MARTMPNDKDFENKCMVLWEDIESAAKLADDLNQPYIQVVLLVLMGTMRDSPDSLKRFANHVTDFSKVELERLRREK